MWLLLALYIIVLDQLSKDLISKTLVNPGFSFGILADHPLLVNSLYVGLLLLIGWFFLKNYDRLKKIQKLAWIFILSGAVSSLIDRVRFGYVIDYITVADQLPTFNLADASVVLGALLLVITYFED